MKYLRVLVLISFILVPLAVSGTDLTDALLKGKVSSFSDKQYFSDGSPKSWTEGALYSQQTTKYNEAGGLSEFEEYSWDSTSLSVSTSPTTSYTYEYNEKGLLIGVRTLPEGSSEVHSYSTKGLLVTIDYLDSAGDLTQKDKYTYDKAGFVTSITKYHGDGTLWEKNTYLNNSLGNPTEIRKFNSAGVLILLESDTLDKSGKYVLEATETNYDATTKKAMSKSSSRSTFWPNGTPKQTRSTSVEGKISTLEYDNRGWETFFNYNEGGAEAFAQRYSYPEIDNHGNWTTKVTSNEVEKFGEKELVVLTVIHREITYFD